MRAKNILLLALALGFGVVGCGGHNEESVQKLPALKIHVQKVTAQERSSMESVPGTVRAKLKATIAAKMTGRIEKLLVSEGSPVQAGQELAILDVREIQAKLDQALALKEQAERDLNRYKALLQQKAVTQSEFDAQEAKAKVARSAADEARTMVGYAKIVAPFNGVVTRKLVDVGDLAVPGMPLLEMEDPSALRFEASVPESILSGISIGQAFEVQIANFEKPLSALVAEVSPIADPNSRTSLVKLDLPTSSELRSGQYGHVSIASGSEPEIRIPNSSLLQRGQLELVFVIENKRAWLRLVRSGRRSAGETQILSGLSDGESIATDEVAKLKDGQSVEVQ